MRGGSGREGSEGRVIGSMKLHILRTSGVVAV